MGNMMRSRTSRLFGSSGSSTPKSNKSDSAPRTSRPPSRTLTLTSPTFAPGYDDGSITDAHENFADFGGCGVEQLAMSLSYVEPYYQDTYISSSETSPASILTTTTSSARWSMDSTHPKASMDQPMREIEEEEEDEDEDEDEEDQEDQQFEDADFDTGNAADFEEQELYMDNAQTKFSSYYDQDEDDITVSDYEDSHPFTTTATIVTLFSVGKAMLIDIILHHAKSVSNASTRTSVNTTRSSSYSYYNDSRSGSATSNSSISDHADIVPVSHIKMPLKAGPDTKPFARRQQRNVTSGTSISPSHVDSVDELVYNKANRNAGIALNWYSSYYPETLDKIDCHVSTREISTKSKDRRTTPPVSMNNKKNFSKLFRH